jgi:uncharacterized protein YcsI (UPF0317 family)
MTTITEDNLKGCSPRDIRAHYRTDEYIGDSWGLAPAYLQTAVAMVPTENALDFFTFCQRNSAACPVLEVLDRGSPVVRKLAEADVATDLGRYRVFREGECVEEPPNVRHLWSEDLVTFLIGCTGSFEPYLMQRGIDLPYVRANRTAPVYKTNRPANSAGVFSGPQAVSMRQISPELITKTVQICSRFPAFHGAPIYFGNPVDLGINDLRVPYAGDPPDLDPTKVPVFWACSVTPQLAALASKIPFMMTNAPGFMFIGDVLTDDMSATA